MKPLAMSFQLVLNGKRLHAEIEIVMDDGTVISRLLPANEKLTIHFDDLTKEAIPSPKSA